MKGSNFYVYCKRDFHTHPLILRLYIKFILHGDLRMVRSMLIVVQFSDGVTSVFQVSVLVDLKPVVVISKVLADVETGQVEFHGQWSVSLNTNTS